MQQTRGWESRRIKRLAKPTQLTQYEGGYYGEADLEWIKEAMDRFNERTKKDLIKIYFDDERYTNVGAEPFKYFKLIPEIYVDPGQPFLMLPATGVMSMVEMMTWKIFGASTKFVNENRRSWEWVEEFTWIVHVLKTRAQVLCLIHQETCTIDDMMEYGFFDEAAVLVRNGTAPASTSTSAQPKKRRVEIHEVEVDEDESIDVIRAMRYEAQMKAQAEADAEDEAEGGSAVEEEYSDTDMTEEEYRMMNERLAAEEEEEYLKREEQLKDITAEEKNSFNHCNINFVFDVGHYLDDLEFHINECRSYLNVPLQKVNPQLFKKKCRELFVENIEISNDTSVLEEYVKYIGTRICTETDKLVVCRRRHNFTQRLVPMEVLHYKDDLVLNETYFTGQSVEEVMVKQRRLFNDFMFFYAHDQMFHFDFIDFEHIRVLDVFVYKKTQVYDSLAELMFAQHII